MIARDATVWTGQINMTGHMNALALDLGREGQDRTVFTDKTRLTRAGLKACEVDLEGFVDGPLETEIIASQDDPAIMSCVVKGDGSTPGDLVYFFGAQILDYEPGAAVGDEYQFGLSAMFARQEGSGGTPAVSRLCPVIRGVVLDQREGVTETTDTPSNPYQFGALTNEERLWAAIHVFDLVGSTAYDIDIQSAPGAGSPTWADRINFPSMDARGSFARYTEGPVTDAFWRVEITVTDAPPPDADNSIDFAVVIGKETI